MAKVALTSGNKTQVDLNDSIGYIFNPSNAEILSVRVDDIEHEPNKLVAILNDIAFLVWRKNTAIDAFKKSAAGWERNYNESNARYKRLKKRLYVAGLILVMVVSLTLFFVGV